MKVADSGHEPLVPDSDVAAMGAFFVVCCMILVFYSYLCGHEVKQKTINR